MYLTFYDIEENRIRKKVADKLLYFGYVRLQYSVFAGKTNPNRFGCWNILQDIVGERSQNKIYCLKISEESFENMKIIGVFEHDFEYLCGKKNTWVF